jgi:hypothetical protein
MDSDGEGAAERLRMAQSLLTRDHASGLAQLNDLFRGGVVSDPPPDGGYAGKLLALDLAPGLTGLASQLAAAWMPWRGKAFDAARARGDNVFTRDSYVPAHLLWPGYRGYAQLSPLTYHAFAFRTSVGPGRTDPDRQVLKIDYDLPGNPGLSVRRVLDELVQIGDGLYLGKAHLHWPWGSWQTIAYFSLERAVPARQ